MIDFSPVYKNGLVVKCRTEEESAAFWAEAKDAFPSKKSYFFNCSYKSLHSTYKDHVAYYLRMCSDGDFRTEWCNMDYYIEYRPYNQSEFVDYGSCVCESSDLGEISSEIEIDVELLFSNEVVV